MRNNKHLVASDHNIKLDAVGSLSNEHNRKQRSAHIGESLKKYNFVESIGSSTVYSVDGRLAERSVTRLIRSNAMDTSEECGYEGNLRGITAGVENDMGDFEMREFVTNE